MDDPETSYLNLEALKSFLKITDQAQDDILRSIIFNTNNHINVLLTPYSDTPIPPGALWEETKYLAMQYALMLWYQSIYQNNQAENYQKIYSERKEDLLKAYKSRKTDKTASSFVAPRNLLQERIYQPTERESYIVREF